MLQLQFDPGSMPDALTCATRPATRDAAVGLTAGAAAGAAGTGAGAGTGAVTGGAGVGCGVVVVLVVATGVGSGAAVTAVVVVRPAALASALLSCERPVTTGSWLITAEAGEDLGIALRAAELPPEAATTRPVAASARARTPKEDRRTSRRLAGFARRPERWSSDGRCRLREVVAA
jgi:hypothetical protein